MFLMSPVQANERTILEQQSTNGEKVKSQGSTADPEASELGYSVTGHCVIASRKLDWRLNRLWKRTEG